jgi:hypothetical protein
VSVEVLDAGGARVTGSTSPVTIALGAGSGPGPLSGTTTVAAVAGVASFNTLQIAAAGGYTLLATSPGITQATSAPFRIESVAVACLAGITCEAVTDTPATQVKVTANSLTGLPDVGFLTASINAGPSVDCPGYTERGPDTALVATIGADRTKTVRLTIKPTATVLMTSSGDYAHLWEYFDYLFVQMCMGSPQPFTTRYGTPAVVDGSFDWNSDGVADPIYLGLLPDCWYAAPPCVSKRSRTEAGDKIIESRLPAGLADPLKRG